MVDIAQLVERLTVDQEVAGSKPVIHPHLLEGALARKTQRLQAWDISFALAVFVS